MKSKGVSIDKIISDAKKLGFTVVENAEEGGVFVKQGDGTVKKVEVLDIFPELKELEK